MQICFSFRANPPVNATEFYVCFSYSQGYVFYTD